MGEPRRPHRDDPRQAPAGDKAGINPRFGVDPEVVSAAVRAIRFPTTRLHELLRQWPSPLERFREAAESLQQEVAEAMPPNWAGREVGEIDRILAMSEETGLNAVWVPRLDVIRQLVGAETETDREAVLSDRRQDILEDIDGCLGEVTHDGVAEEQRLAKEAVAAVRDGYEAPGQALAASVLSGLVHTTFDFERFAEARERFIRDDPDHVALRMFRITAILRTFGRALTKTDEADPGFNRHASLHAHEGHYSVPNAMSALLLLGGVIREVDHGLHRQERAAGD